MGLFYMLGKHCLSIYKKLIFLWWYATWVSCTQCFYGGMLPESTVHNISMVACYPGQLYTIFLWWYATRVNYTIFQWWHATRVSCAQYFYGGMLPGSAVYNISMVACYPGQLYTIFLWWHAIRVSCTQVKDEDCCFTIIGALFALEMIGWNYSDSQKVVQLHCDHKRSKCNLSNLLTEILVRS